MSHPSSQDLKIPSTVISKHFLKHFLISSPSSASAAGVERRTRTRQKIGALPVSKAGHFCVDQQSIGEFVCLFFNMLEGIGFKLSKSFLVHGSLTG